MGQTDPKKPVEHLSFSLVWANEQGEEQTYDLISCRQAGRMAWAIPLAIIPIAGIAWLGYSAYYRNEDKQTICKNRLPEIKALISQIKSLLETKEIQGHPFVSGDAPMRLQFVGECYEAAANVKDSVLTETLDAQLHNVAIALAEAQAIHVRLQVIIVDANKGKGWLSGIGDSLAAMNPFGGEEEPKTNEDDGELGAHHQVPDIQVDSNV